MIRRLAWVRLLAVSLGTAACGNAESAPGMDEVGRSLVRLGDRLRQRGEGLRDAAATGSDQPHADAVRAAGERWLSEGAAIAAEGARVLRAAEIVGLGTAGGRRPANASQVYLSGIEGEGEGLVVISRSLTASADSLRATVRQLQATGALSAAEAAPLADDAAELAALSVSARSAGNAILEQARRQRQSLGERVR